MKNNFILFLALSPLLLVGCAKPSIDMPKSPFKDNYKRIGMRGEYTIASKMDRKDFNAIKTYVADPTDDNVTNYIREDETRDLKYAYFGKESSSISQCSMLSHQENFKAYGNDVTITDDITDEQTKSANSGIIKTKVVLGDYIFADSYLGEPEGTYSRRLSTKNNEEPEEVTTSVDHQAIASDTFTITPVKRISDRFKQSDISGKFKLAGDNVIYGKTSDNKFLIKEGYSHFDDFKTTMGRTYKSVNNYFYEGLLEKYNDNQYRFTNFRFYHELLILSKAFMDNVPIIYLSKPVLIEYSEVKYQISYTSIGDYDGEIPDPTR